MQRLVFTVVLVVAFGSFTYAQETPANDLDLIESASKTALTVSMPADGHNQVQAIFNQLKQQMEKRVQARAAAAKPKDTKQEGKK